MGKDAGSTDSGAELGSRSPYSPSSHNVESINDPRVYNDSLLSHVEEDEDESESVEDSSCCDKFITKVKDFGHFVVTNFDLFCIHMCHALIMSYPMTAEMYISNDNMGMDSDPGAMSTYNAVIFQVFTFKFLFGLLSDKVPILRYRRIPYVVISVVILCISYLLFAYVVMDMPTLYAAGIVQAIGECMFTSAVDALTLIRGTPDGARQSDIQTSVGFVMSFGMSAASALSSLAFLHWNEKQVMLSALGFPLLGAVVAIILLKDQKLTREESKIKCKCSCDTEAMKKGWHKVKDYFSTWWILALFLFTGGIMPKSSTAESSWVYSLPVSQSTMSALNCMNGVGAQLGDIVYWLFFRRQAARWKFIMISVAIMGVICSVCKIGIVSGIGGDTLTAGQQAVIALEPMIAGFASRMLMLPVVILVSLLVPSVAVAAFHYSFFFSIENLGSSISGYITTPITRALNVTSDDGFANLWKLIVVCTVLGLLPLCLLPFLPMPDQKKNIDQLYMNNCHGGMVPPTALSSPSSHGRVATQETLENEVKILVEESEK